MNKKRFFQALGIVFVGSALWVYLWLRSYGVIPSPVYDTVRPDIPLLSTQRFWCSIKRMALFIKRAASRHSDAR
jgi:hypothetical protein